MGRELLGEKTLAIARMACLVWRAVPLRQTSVNGFLRALERAGSSEKNSPVFVKIWRIDTTVLVSDRC